MNKIFNSIIALSALLIATSATAKTTDEVVISASELIEPNAPAVSVQKKGETLVVAFDVAMPAKYLDDKEAYVLTPELKNGEWTLNLPSLSIEGRTYERINAAKNAKELAKDHRQYLSHVSYRGEQMTVHYQTVVPYQQQMNGSQMVLLAERVDNCGSGKCQSVAEQMFIDKSIDGLGCFVKGDQVAYFDPSPFQVHAVYDENFKDVALFQLNKAKFTDPSAYRALSDKIKEIQTEGKILSVNVITASSPDGPYEQNELLAKERASMINNLLVSELGVDPSIITIKTIAENWEGFEQAVKESGTYIQNYANIMKMPNLEGRESTLLQTGNNHDVVMDIFKSLRNCHVSIDYTTAENFNRQKTTYNNCKYVPVTLGAYYPVMDMIKVVKLYEKEANAVNTNNLMVAWMERGEWEKALELAGKISNVNINPVYANNKAVLYGRMGEPRMAATLFDIEPQAPGAIYNKGVMQLMNGQYAAASKTLATFNNVNSIVASIYAGNYCQAAKQSHLAESSAEVLYLRAIAYTAMGDKELAIKTLAPVCSADANLRRKAAVQPELIALHGDKEFEAIIK